MTLALLIYHDLVDGEVKKYGISSLNGVSYHLEQFIKDDCPYILVIKVIKCDNEPSDDHPRFALKRINDTPGVFNVTFTRGKVIIKMTCDVSTFLPFMFNHLD